MEDTSFSACCITVFSLPLHRISYVRFYLALDRLQPNTFYNIAHTMLLVLYNYTDLLLDCFSAPCRCRSPQCLVVLHPLAHVDGPPAPQPYETSQEPMRLRLLRVVLDSMVKVLQLLVPDPPQRPQQLPKLLSNLIPLRLPPGDNLQQRPDLRVVVVPNLRLHRLRARHGRLAAHQRGAPPQRRRSGRPERVQRRGADAVLREEGVEGVEVGGLLRVHVGHEGAEVRVARDDGGRLRRVD